MNERDGEREGEKEKQEDKSFAGLRFSEPCSILLAGILHQGWFLIFSKMLPTKKPRILFYHRHLTFIRFRHYETQIPVQF